MMRSLYSGVSGLRIHQTKMDVIGNNIANVGTTAFKSSRVTFNEIFAQTLQGGTAASKTGAGGRNPMQIGLGANVASIDVQMTEGASQRTDNALDLKIEGDGFFVVNDGNGQKFTRAGAFRVDEAGNLVDPNGYKVCGWKVDATTGQVVKGPVQPLSIMGADTYSIQPAKTTKLSFEGNMSLDDGELGVPLTMNFFDSLGNKYTAQATSKFDTNDNKWKIANFDYIKDSKGKDVTYNGGDLVAGTLSTAIELEFDVNGNLTNPTDGIATLDFSSVQPFDGVNSEIGDQNKSITFNFSELTQYSSTTTANSKTVDGTEPGEFTGFNIGADGKIVAKYSNGDNKVLGQVVITTFKNPSGLLKAGDNLFEASANSGGFDGIGMDPTTTGGINSGVLEMSNVDLSKEFTEMIVTQRGFQANSKIITTTDEMLQELTNLKR